MTDRSLLPKDKPFSELLPAFLLPYAAYVGLGSLPTAWMRPDAAGLLRFAVVLALIWFFRGRYRFGAPLTPRLCILGLAAACAACALWVAAYRLSLQLPCWQGRIAKAATVQPSFAYWLQRTAGSVLLVPVFEELFCRVYLCELLFAAATEPGKPGGLGLVPDLRGRMEAHPVPLAAPPLSAASIAGTTLIFTLGHDVAAWIPAILYFLFTYWVYAKTGSFRICVGVHAWTNLAIALMVLVVPDLRFLWF